MKGEIAQIAALTIHGNYALAGNPVESFFPDHPVFRYCQRVNFVKVGKSLFGKDTETAVAKNPLDWFRYLQRKQARGILLFHSPQNHPLISDRMSAGFVGGGGIWSLVVQLSRNQAERWLPRWEVWDRNAPRDQIWRVTYGQVSKGKSQLPQPPQLPGIQEDLHGALQEIRAFSSRYDYFNFFTGQFAAALKILESNSPLEPQPTDLAPAGFLPPGVNRLLRACQTAWVFGAMGSWNDYSFQGAEGEEYERVSGELFQTLNKAIFSATNQSFFT